MTRSKKVFAVFALAFFLFLAFVVYDISTRTTFPGSEYKERPLDSAQDSVRADSTRH